MQTFSSWVIKNRKFVLLLTLLITLVSLYLMKDIRINSDIISYLPQDDPTVISFNEMGKKFGGNYMAMVALKSNDIFSRSSLMTIKTLTDSIEKLDGVSSVTSLTNILDFKEIEGGLEVGKLLEGGKIPDTPQALRALKSYTLSKSMYKGSLVSANGKVTVIIARLRDNGDRIKIAKQIRSLTQSIVPQGITPYFGGLPMQMSYLNQLIWKNMAFLTPIVAVLIVLVLFFSFNSKRGVLLPFTTVVLSTLWGFGAMAVFGYQITLITGIFPVLLLAVGSAYGIHMVNKYYEDIRTYSDPETATKKALTDVGIPIILAGVTTLFGFLSLLTSDLSLIQQFGLISAFGVLFALLASITFLPAILSHMPIDSRYLTRVKKNKNTSFVVHLMDGFSVFILKREKLILALTGVMVLFGVLGFPKITRNVNMLEYFKPSSEIRQSESLMEKYFGGSIPIQLHVKGNIKNPAILEEMRLVERKLEVIPNVNKPQSIADLICEMNRVMNGRYVVPDSKEGVGNLWFMLEGQNILSQMITPDNREAQIQANLGTMDTQQIIAIVDSLNYFLSTLPDTLFTLSRDSLPEVIKTQADAYLFNRVIQNLTLELQKRDPHFHQFTPSFLEQLKTQISNKNLPDTLVAQVAKIGAAYLASDESDIYVTSPSVRWQFQQGLLHLVAQRSIHPKQIQRLLRRTVPASYIEDSESLYGTAASIASIIENRIDTYRVNRIVGFLRNHLPALIVQSDTFNRDMSAAVWPIFNHRLFVDANTFHRWQQHTHIPLIERTVFSITQSGMAPIFKQLDSQLLRSQISSMGMALILVFVLLIFQFRSLTGGIIGITPVLLTILINFGVMGFFHIPMDDATMMIASLSIGIGIDYSIHFASRFKRENTRQQNVHAALKTTLDTTGVAILINALAVGLGFLVMLLGDIVPLQRFGWLTALAMLTSATGAIFVLPALIITTHAGFIGNWYNLKNTINKKMTENIKGLNKKFKGKGGK